MRPKDRLDDLKERLRELAKQQDPIALAAIELVRLLADDAKESLVVADEHDMLLRQQGAVRMLEKLHKELTTMPPSITPGATA